MAAPKGHPRYGGRKKGVLNRDTLPLAEKAKALGVDPFEILLMFAKGDWEGLGYPASTHVKAGKGGEAYEVETITADHRLRAASEACQYLHPKRKAIEVVEDKKDIGEDPLAHLTDEELDQL